MSQATGTASVVLVHGGFVDGSGWQAVHQALTAKGHRVSIVQHPTVSLGDDVAYTKRAIAALEGPVILVGHSYGGVVITEAGTDAKVSALVYVAAFAPDEGESVSSLIQNPPPGARCPRSSLRKTDSCFSTGRSSVRRSPPMSNRAPRP